MEEEQNMKLNPRNDKDMAFMLRFENVAWYEDGVVRILDRRIYPIRTEFVTCRTYPEVAAAIRDMVTQSEGPYTACLMGMALAVHEVKDKAKEKILEYTKQAAYDLSHARPTTSAKMTRLCDHSYETIRQALDQGISGTALVEKAFEVAYNYTNNNYARYDRIGALLADKFPDNGTVMTMCFAGTVIGTMLRYCKNNGKNIKLICCETRPYLQGARLTASCCRDMGFDTTVICDNMPAYTMHTKKVDVFTSAADVITCRGDVCNKVGTFQVAMAANYYGIPYYVTGSPDIAHKDASTIHVEERDPREVISFLGQQTVMDGVKGYYPAFDITPPEFVTGIVTERGVFTPAKLDQYFKADTPHLYN